MREQFTPSWVSCLDKFMSFWSNVWNSPSWVCVTHKPCPFGNEYHAITCLRSNIFDLKKNQFIEWGNYKEILRRSAPKRRHVVHELMTIPPHVKTWNGQKWICTAKFRYQQDICRGVCVQKIHPNLL